MKNEKAWSSCDELKADANSHQLYTPLRDAFAFRHLSSADKARFVKDKALAEEAGCNVPEFRGGSKRP